MTDLVLSPEILSQLEELAQADRRPVSDVLADLVKEYLARRHDEKISAEAARFREQHAALWAQYPGQYIAMRDGQVLDHDVDLSALRQRIRAQYGNAPILLAPVTAEPETEFRVRRPRLEQVTS